MELTFDLEKQTTYHIYVFIYIQHQVVIRTGEKEAG